MSAWDNIVANSTLAEADGDAWDHLINPSLAGGQSVLLIPYSEIILDIQTDRMSADIQNEVLTLDIEKNELEIDVYNMALSAEFENNIKEIEWHHHQPN